MTLALLKFQDSFLKSDFLAFGFVFFSIPLAATSPEGFFFNLLSKIFLFLCLSFRYMKQGYGLPVLYSTTTVITSCFIVDLKTMKNWRSISRN